MGTPIQNIRISSLLLALTNPAIWLKHLWLREISFIAHESVGDNSSGGKGGDKLAGASSTLRTDAGVGSGRDWRPEAKGFVDDAVKVGDITD